MEDMKETYKALYSFVMVMKEKLDANSHKGNIEATRENGNIEWLWMRLQGEMGELYSEITAKSPNPELIARECADVANFAMFIADKARQDSERAEADGVSPGKTST